MAGQLSKSCEISEEFDLDDFTNDVEKVILLQAVFRGCLVRKCLADVRREFDVIARETDPQNGNFSVEWKGPNICLPTYKKNRKKTQKNVEETTFKNRIDCDAEPHPRAELAKETLGTSECKISTANVNQNACCCRCSVPHVHTNGSQDGVENNASDTNFAKNKNSGTDKTDIGDTDSGSHCDIKGYKEFSCVTGDNSALLTSLGNPEVMDHHNNDIEFSETASLLSVVKSLGVQTDRQDEKNKHQAELEAEAKVAGAGKEGGTLMQRGQNSNTHNLSEDKGGYSNSKRQPDRPLIDVLEPQPETSLHHTDSTLPQQDSTLHLSDRSLREEPESTLTLPDSSPQMPARTLPPQDSTLQLADSTCLWEDSTMAQPQTPYSNNTTDLSWSRDPEALREKRQHIAMELLWVQQAILSRKNYLRLKQQMKSPVV